MGGGTSTYDGVSIAWAVVEYIHNHPQHRAHALFATHHHELTQLSYLLPGIRNYNVVVSEADGALPRKQSYAGCQFAVANQGFQKNI